ncbi:hypothetical protein DEI20_23785 [Salmonella enterica subsp. enterica serovar Newport]|nr:hypothetical protein [Salmonella enterica subsp. enterica serovar Newport]MJR82253.1 hypothetical protein [Salmonella enterica subsp. enterica serovar Newport]
MFIVEFSLDFDFRSPLGELVGFFLLDASGPLERPAFATRLSNIVKNYRVITIKPHQYNTNKTISNIESAYKQQFVQVVRECSQNF